MNIMTNGLPANPDIAKAQAKRLRTALAPRLDVSHGQSLELIARVHGEPSWGRLNSLLGEVPPSLPADPAQAAPHSGTVAGLPPRPRSGEETRPSFREPGEAVDQVVLRALWRALGEAKELQPSDKLIKKAAELRRMELIPLASVEPYLDLLDVGLGGMVFDMGASRLIEICGVEMVDIFERPKARATRAIGVQGLRPASFSALLVWLERLGLDVHPEVFCAPLAQDLRRARFLTADELTCLWHEREKKRFKTAELFVDRAVDEAKMTTRTVDGRNGVKITITHDAQPHGLIKSLHIYR